MVQRVSSSSKTGVVEVMVARWYQQAQGIELSAIT